MSNTLSPTINRSNNTHIGGCGIIRDFSSSSNNNNNKSDGAEGDAVTKTETVIKEETVAGDANTAAEQQPANSHGEGGPGGGSSSIREMVQSVRPRLKQVSQDINPGDLLSVYGIVALIALIIAAPTAIKYMRRSDSTYEDIDPEDDVTHIAKSVYEEILPELDSGTLFGGDGEGRKKSGSGLDSLVADLLNSPQIQQAVNSVIVKLLKSEEVKQSAQLLLKELFQDLIDDPETLQQIIHLLRHAIQDEQIKEASIQLVTEVFSDSQVLDELVELVQKLGQEKEVQISTQALLVDSAHNALNDPEILDHSMEFATDVVGDDIVQQTAGEALYNTLSYAVRPTLSIGTYKRKETH